MSYSLISQTTSGRTLYFQIRKKNLNLTQNYKISINILLPNEVL
ncbi:hypothetical protein LEP1GSC150_5576 [Leptospira interrogans serovar Copenhageni str. LT2050]|uniref:Uncharacterized protein n=1 Tax=Leptospira interrogans serovar Copenhageni str. LT2050 TaxID=1001598 RepID=M3IFJ1_LEPIT|nr:hypothetical protein LEP1GSC150_5576 [Leptospira interrogans serovar Copenhageni str. LT2050]